MWQSSGTSGIKRRLSESHLARPSPTPLRIHPFHSMNSNSLSRVQTQSNLGRILDRMQQPQKAQDTQAAQPRASAGGDGIVSHNLRQLEITQISDAALSSPLSTSVKRVAEVGLPPLVELGTARATAQSTLRNDEISAVGTRNERGGADYGGMSA